MTVLSLEILGPDSSLAGDCSEKSPDISGES